MGITQQIEDASVVKNNSLHLGIHFPVLLYPALIDVWWHVSSTYIREITPAGLFSYQNK